MLRCVFVVYYYEDTESNRCCGTQRVWLARLGSSMACIDVAGPVLLSHIASDGKLGEGLGTYAHHISVSNTYHIEMVNYSSILCKIFGYIMQVL